jgi:hypothetical protein
MTIRLGLSGQADQMSLVSLIPGEVLLRAAGEAQRELDS